MASNKSQTWFLGIFILFAGRGILMSSWSSQGPAVKGALELSTSNMGLYQMVISLGSILGVVFAGKLLHMLGSRYISLASYLLMGASIIGLGYAVANHDLVFACIFTALIGIPFGIGDFDNNFEAGEIDRRSGRNRVPMLHFGYSGAVLVGATLTGMLIAAKVSVTDSFLWIGLFVIVSATVGSMMIPTENGRTEHKDASAASSSVKVKDILRQSRYVKIVAIAFAFVVTEGAAVLWIPITLTGDGMSRSAAALAFAVFAGGMALLRVIGGRIADTIGRHNVIRWGALIAGAGIFIFMLTPVLHLPFVGIALWGIGDSIGISMAVAAMSDDHTGQHAKQTLLWLVVYFANFTVGPTLGFISKLAGNYLSFLFPLATLAVAFTFRNSVKPKAQAAK